MKRNVRKITAAIALAVMSIQSAVAAFADVQVDVRIEGVEEKIYQDKVTVEGDEVTVKDVLEALDKAEEALTITIVEGDYGPYLTKINDTEGGGFGGFDGWLYWQNGKEAASGIGDCIVKDGDSILVYYGDPYGVGMQYPKLEYKDGVITITSDDTTYDENYNPVVTTNPVAGATVKWDDKEYTSDEEGRVTIDNELLKAGEHTVYIERYSEEGLPTVLRTTDKVTIKDEKATDADKAGADESKTDSEKKDKENNGNLSTILLAAGVTIIVVAVVVVVLKKKNEKK